MRSVAISAFTIVALFICFSDICVAQRSSAPNSKTRKEKPQVDTREVIAAMAEPVAEQPKPVEPAIVPAPSKPEASGNTQKVTKAQRAGRVLTPTEEKAYDLFRKEQYDEASTYFAQLAKDKVFIPSEPGTENIDKVVLRYVDAAMVKFLEKSEFEKTATYLDRISETNRAKKIQQEADKIFDVLKQSRRVKISIKNFTLGRYDADEEIFYMKSSDGTYAVNVDINSARAVKANFGKIEIRNMNFSVENGKLALTKFSLVNPANSKQYFFDEGLPTSYDITDIVEFYDSLLGKLPSKGQNEAKQDTAVRRSVSRMGRNDEARIRRSTITPPAVEKKKTQPAETRPSNKIRTSVTPAAKSQPQLRAAAPVERDVAPQQPALRPQPRAAQPQQEPQPEASTAPAKVTETKTEVLLEN
ncbi:MAG: hypothetical protein LBK47_06380 [Prevotellaceae bacterium]|jgi:hypothetical protein|nr:hypothetical protein [Prevotellaceae bacterium]